MKKREVLFRRLVFVLCAGFVCAAAVFPGGVRAAAMEGEAFARLCETGTADQVRDALKAGAEPNSRVYYVEMGSVPALTLAAGAGNLPVVRVLLPALRQAEGFSVDEADVDIGVTALMAASEAAKTPELLEMIRLLLDAGAKVNAKDADGVTPLMHAAAHNPNPEAFRMLLAAGAKLDSQDDNGWTVLMHAAGGNTAAMTRVVLETGADVNAKGRDGDTALMRAAYGNPAPEVVKILVAAGAKVDERTSGDDATGETALMWAAGRNRAAVVAALLEAGANPKLKDKAGRDALRHARESAKEGSRNIEDETERRAEDEKVIRLLEGGAKR